MFPAYGQNVEFFRISNEGVGCGMVLNFGGECGNSLSLAFPMKVKDLWTWGAWTDTVLSNSYSS